MEYKVEINTKKCKGCFYCVKFCPVKKIIISDSLNKKGYQVVSVDPEVQCIGCNNCILMCADGCIKLITKQESTAIK